MLRLAASKAGRGGTWLWRPVTGTKPLTRADTLLALRKSGVVDGATGTPLHVKLAEPAPVLVIDAVEGEPSYTVTTLLMERNARELADGIRAISDLGFRRVVLAVNDWTLDESDALASRADEAGFEIAEVAGDFREADEAAIVRAALGRPLEAGTTGTVAATLETVFHAHRALLRGKPQTTKIVQMAGTLETAHVFEVPLGAAIDDCARIANAPDGAHAYALGARERRAGVRSLELLAGGAVHKTTDTILVVDPTLADPLDLALETMTPVDRIVEVADSIRLARLPLPAGESPVVKVGESVRKGQIVAHGTAIGVEQHAPFDGTVRAVGPGEIEIAR